MPKNPERYCQGGDVEGTKKIVVTHGESIDVSAASFDPGYPIENSLTDGEVDFKMSDVIRGYSDSGANIGERVDMTYKHTAKAKPEDDNEEY